MTSSVPEAPRPVLPREVEVAVVGGGPVGMLLATELALRDVRVVVVERAAEPCEEPKAGTLHARTVQSLVRRGVLAGGPLDAAPDAEVTTPFHFAGMSGLTITAPAVEGAPIAGLPQARVERYFEDRATRLGARVFRRHEVRGLTRHPDRVDLEVADLTTGISRPLSARWAVGTDGARGTVRTAAGIAAGDHPATFSSIVALARLLEPRHAPIGWNRTPRGWTMTNVNPAGPSRIITFDWTLPAPDRHSPVTADELRRTLDRIVGRPVPFTDLRIARRTGDFARLADTYRLGRVLLAGDAAHHHSAMGGQGLNLGLQDAFNLGWKLASVIRDGADVALLDTYTDERRPAARRVIDNTRVQSQLMRPDATADPLRALTRELLALPEARRHIGDMISAQDVAYPPSTAAGVSRDAPDAGTFATDRPLTTPGGGPTRLSDLLADGNAVLISETAGDTATLSARIHPWADRVTIAHAKPAHAHPPRARLVRPDGYIAWSAPHDELAAHRLEGTLTALFGPRDAGTPSASHTLAATGR
ncbi:FAD-dependent monooxygenase [Embleya hyalina]|uniref:FAD-binding domain-containing protein n=1 Tax=Embleya hyalina TaxID=516124 RepID=A0A401YM56_9ACTN|nr:FAD-dependent monooxygenase [Embleya hyalina]GCD95700.1 hypothetical protein EHYA_03383 [Embleya hyalina]